MYYVYILRCVDDSLYTGITTDVKRRFNEHCGCNANGAKYTKSHKPAYIEAVWRSLSRSEASKLELFIKHLSKSQKNELIATPLTLNSLCREKFAECNFEYDPTYKKYHT